MLEDVLEQPTDASHIGRVRALWARRRSGNPYASLSSWAETEECVLSPAMAPQAGNALTPSLASVTERVFESECRRIFRQYGTSQGARTLPAHQRAFIERNRGRSGHRRAALLRELRRYDLGNVIGIRPHFNRERVDFTVQKLAEIERAVGGVE